MKRNQSKKRAVVLLSGGMDSTVALYWARQQGYTCVALSFDYGQRHRKELKSAARVARLAAVAHHVVKFKLPWGGSSLLDDKAPLPRHALSQMSTGLIPSTYVPARNTLFLSFALSLADALKASALVLSLIHISEPTRPY